MFCKIYLYNNFSLSLSSFFVFSFVKKVHVAIVVDNRSSNFCFFILIVFAVAVLLLEAAIDIHC